MYLVTGAAGFIGYHTARALLRQGHTVIGVDNLNNYYDVQLKEARLRLLGLEKNFTFLRCDIADANALAQGLGTRLANITHVIHLAAQAGVRHSLKEPMLYVHSNVEGQLVMLELCRRLPKLQHFVYASSSSVYGANTALPFKPSDRTDSPVSLYAATKKAGEIMTESYVRLYDIPATCLRFFTAYGPLGRPDMAYFSFTQNILAKKPIRLFNNGDMQRDFTYIDDVVAGVLGASLLKPRGVPHRLYNIGSGRKETLAALVSGLEQALGVSAIKEYDLMQQGDLQATCADISDSERDFGYAPKVALPEGLLHFVRWYKDFYAPAG